jgi:two-component system cell cycle response regulator CtrA
MSYLAELERKYIDALERIKVLEQENESLRTTTNELCAVPDVPLALHLTGRETKVFAALLAAPGLLNKEQILAKSYDDRYGLDDEPEIKIIDIFICKIRRKIKPFCLQIDTVWAMGYSVPPETKATVRRMNEDAQKDLLRRSKGQ